jgi:hypothetical protein
MECAPWDGQAAAVRLTYSGWAFWDEGYGRYRERNCKNVAVQSLFGRLDPALEAVTLPTLGLDEHDPGCLDEQNPQVAIAALGCLAQDSAVPVDICLGNRPSQAAKSRSLVNASPVPIAATIALEMIGPMPGTLISRSQPASWRAMALISPDKPSIRSSSRRRQPNPRSLTPTDYERVRDWLRKSLPQDSAGRIRYGAHANDVKGRVPRKVHTQTPSADVRC